MKSVERGAPAARPRVAALLLLVLGAAVIVRAHDPPRLLLTLDDFARIQRAVQVNPWAATVRSGILQSAQDWPATQNSRYGLSEWQLPPEGGQWSLWYVCPVHGVSLQFKGPGQNICPVDSKNFTGWPYDQVIYGRRHSDNANAARDNALAFRLTGDASFAREAARILLAYADIYSTYPIKDTNNKLNATSGGRVTAQTLDEAGWLIPIVWAYDLISGSGAMDAGQQAHVERDLLRAAVGVISRNDAGASNWQSWHNAAIGGVGFALEDAALITSAIDGKSGFRFQMRNSVYPDGFWYEGAWGYHFFALQPHCFLAEMAARSGIDLYSDPSLRLMFTAPLRFAMPDWTLPPFNDSANTSIISNDTLYEMAYARYRDALFASVLGLRSRGREALFWGAESLPQAAAQPQGSLLFPDSGDAVLRIDENDSYLALKFGPHGGWHGHYDKLGFVYYARGGIAGVDPGTQSYAAPTHTTWDKVTLAHNTVVVDETTQAEATGRVLAFAALPSVSAARADAGAVYKQAALGRTMFLTPEYALDVFDARSTDGAQHRFDWIYHNNGAASTPLALAPYTALPAQNGYQHLSAVQATDTSADLLASFDMNDPNLAYGSIYTNVAAISATFQYSREQAASGLFSGRMGYDFSASQGYILFSTPTLARQPMELPLGVSLMIHGDGSGHKLAVRLYDATDERFVYTAGPINWTGWRRITATNPQGWSHYLGNADGVFDLPAKSAAVELTSVAGGPVRGALFVDDITIDYAGAGSLKAADFERTLRSLRFRMLGASGTTFVTGNGLGPDLLKPVPFVMARRRGTSAHFAACLEPYGDAPRITAFNEAADGSLQVTAADFDDRVSLDSAGALRFVRRRSGALSRVAVWGATVLTDSGQDVLRASAPVALQADYADNGRAISVRLGAPLTADTRLLAPAATSVTLNGTPIPLRREGDYLLISAVAMPDPRAAVNAASYVTGISPGGLFSLFGLNLAAGTAVASGFPLPLTMQGTSVTVNGQDAPLLYVSPLQVNAQAPLNLASGPADVRVTTPGGTASLGAAVSAATPGVFVAVPGSSVVIYATGLGSVVPAIPAGWAAPLQPLSTCTLQVSVTIGGKDAPVSYCGLAPGWAGLWQVNAQWPAGVPAGPQPMVVTANGVSSNTYLLR